MVFPFPTFGYSTGSAPPSPIIPDRSLDFERDSTQYISMSGANFGALNNRKWTIHTWYKRESTTATMNLFAKNPAGSLEPFLVRFNTANTIQVIIRGSDGNLIGNLNTTATFTDTTSWHHLAIYLDTANGTSGDRLQMWHDGLRIVDFAQETQPSQNAEAADAADGAIYIGYNGSSNSYDGLLYQPAFFDNANPAIGSLISGGHPVDITGVPGLYSLLNTMASGDLTDDYVLTPNWTNNNTVVMSTDIPT